MHTQTSSNPISAVRGVDVGGAASFGVIDLVDIARGSAVVHVLDEAWERVAQSHERFVEARENGAVYGATTGVGANRGVAVVEDTAEREAHGLRLLRSHASGVGPLEDEGTTRAALVVRLVQILRGGSGISTPFAGALANAIEHDALPAVHRTGTIGTGDLTALAEIALTLVGELPWRSGGVDPVPFAEGDALPFMSSSAVTLARSALAAADAREVVAGADVVTGLSFLALRGSAEPYEARVTRGRPHAAQADVAARLWSLTGNADGSRSPGVRIQDPFGLRVAPQVHAPAVAAVERLIEAIEVEINSATENPLVTDDGVRHHGQFHLATLAAVLDAARVAVHPVLTLSASRLGLLMRSDMTGLAPFLATGAASSSGLMITEYVVQDLLAEMRVATTPVTPANISVSLGLEEHASFAPQSARMLGVIAEHGRTVLGVELVAAVRALRMAPDRVIGTRLEPVYEHLSALLGDAEQDRPLGADIERAAALVPELPALV